MKARHLFASAFGLPLVVWVCLAGRGFSQPNVNGDDPTPYLRLEIGAHTAPINAIAFSPDSQRLYTAGDDKAVQVWERNPATGNWASASRMRWEVGPGPHGIIYSLAVTPMTGRVFAAGYGNRGFHGEIAGFKEDGSYFAASMPNAGLPNQHGRSIWSLAMSPDGNWFASADLEGKVILWPGEKNAQAGELQAYQTIYEPHKAKLDTFKRYPVAFLGSSRLLYPRLRTPGNPPVWQIECAQLDVANRTKNQNTTTLPGAHKDLVTAMAGSADGRFAAVGSFDQLTLYEFRGEKPPTSVPLAIHRNEYVYSLAFNPNGDYLAVGVGDEKGGREIQLWDLAKRQKLPWHAESRFIVDSCAFSPDGNHFAYVSGSGNDVSVATFQNGAVGNPQVLAGGAQIGLVGFGSTPPGNEKQYKVYFATGSLDKPDKWFVFDPAQSGDNRITGLDGVEGKPPGFYDETFERSGWAATPTRDGLTLSQNKVNRGTIKLNKYLGDSVTTFRWICAKKSKGPPVAIAVATLNNHIYVYKLDNLNVPRRVYRGHESQINYLNISPDQEYLVSGSDDGTASIWHLDDSLTKVDEIAKNKLDEFATNEKWGVTFENNGRTIKQLEKLGPLLIRGLKVGDVLEEIEWTDQNDKVRHEKDANRFPAILRNAEPNLDITFHVTRGPEKAKIAMQSNSARYPLLSLYTRDGQWIAWTPNGYYDSSFVKGAELIGWQFTRGLGESPKFFTAEQVYRDFRKPEVIRKVLAQQTVPVKIPRPDVNPDVRIVAPIAPQFKALTHRLVINAQIKPPPNCNRLEAILMAVVTDPKTKQQSYHDVGRKELNNVQPAAGAFNASWQVDLDMESSRSFFVRVINYSFDENEAQGGFADSNHININWPAPAPPPPQNDKPTLRVLAIGVTRYKDQQKWGEPLATKLSAKKIREVFDQHYDRRFYGKCEAVALSDGTTGEMITKKVEELVNGAAANDVVVLFYSGHGTESKNIFSLVPSDGPETLDTKRLFEFFERRLEHGVLILDACYSASAVSASNVAFDSQQRGWHTWVYASSESETQQPVSGSSFMNGIVAALSTRMHTLTLYSKVKGDLKGHAHEGSSLVNLTR